MSRNMDRARLNKRTHCSGSTPSEESALDLEKYCCSYSNLPSLSPPTLQPYASAGQHSESNAAYFSWPSRLNDAAEERANYFGNLQKGVLPETLGRLPEGQRATTLLDLMTIRASHSKLLRCYSLGTAIGFRIRRGVLTDIPAILVFVSRKVHKQWLSPIQCLPTALEVIKKMPNYLLSYFCHPLVKDFPELGQKKMTRLYFLIKTKEDEIYFIDFLLSSLAVFLPVTFPDRDCSIV